MAEIAAATNEQSIGLNEVNLAVSHMDQVTQQNAAMVEEVTAAAASLKGEGVELARLVTRFRTGAEAARPAPEAAREGRHQPARNPVRRAQAQIAAAAQQWEEF